MRQAPALVLSGGGARGAYEAGVIAGLVDVLGQVRFSLVAGTSVGAINAAFLAGHAHRPDLEIHRLLELWRGLGLRTHLRPARLRDRRSFLDVRPFERLIRDSVDWSRLRRNLERGHLDGFFVAALEVDTGRTAVFADLAEHAKWHPSRDPQRVPVRTRIGPEHVLASAAIPGVFPARRVGRGLYYDGGLRFNTPISPVLRTGAERLVVVSPLHPVADEPVHREAADLDPLFLAGKLFHAVLLDPFSYDLQVLERFNELLSVLDDTLTDEERAVFDARCIETRGAPYRHVDAMVFKPSKDLGQLAIEFLLRHRRSVVRQGLSGFLLGAAAPRIQASGTDLISYVLFDGRFTDELIALGRRDVAARADEVRAFFVG